MNSDNPTPVTTILAWSISRIFALTLAALVGGFAGWASGAAAGEWLEYGGVPEAMSWGGRIGGFLGAVLCPGYVTWKLIREDRDGGQRLPEGRRHHPS